MAHAMNYEEYAESLRRSAFSKATLAALDAYSGRVVAFESGQFRWIRMNHDSEWSIGLVKLTTDGEPCFFGIGDNARFSIKEVHEVGARIMPPE